jgi:hypothetical protein
MPIQIFRACTTAQTEEFIAGCIRDWLSALRQAYVLALRDRIERPIGMIEARLLSHIVDVGYVLARSHWGNGLIPEAIRAHVRHKGHPSTHSRHRQSTGADDPEEGYVARAALRSESQPRSNRRQPHTSHWQR